MRNLSILFLLVCAPIFAFAQGGPGQSNYPVSQITFQNNGTPVTPAVNGSVIINYVSGCTTTVSGSTASITCTGGGGLSSIGLTVNGGASSGAVAISGSPLIANGTLNIAYTGSNGDVMTFGASNAPTDSGTLLSSLAPLSSPSFTTPTLGSASYTNLVASTAGSHLKTSAANKDISGTCTMTSGACTLISFTAAYTSQPACTVTWDGITGTLTGVLSSHAATTGLTPTSSVGTDTAKVFYVCVGNPN